jgi:hypothetical protein
MSCGRSPWRTSTLAAVMICVAASIGRAQANDDEADAALFLESVVMAKRGPLCAARIVGFAEKFEPALARWRADRAVRLDQGEAILRAAAAKEQLDFALHVATVTDTAARLLGKASQAVLETNCEAMHRRVVDP